MALHHGANVALSYPPPHLVAACDAQSRIGVIYTLTENPSDGALTKLAELVNASGSASSPYTWDKSTSISVHSPILEFAPTEAGTEVEVVSASAVPGPSESASPRNFSNENAQAVEIYAEELDRETAEMILRF